MSQSQQSISSSSPKPKPKSKPSASHAPTVNISNLWPSIEGGRYPVKRITGQPVEVWADIFKDGHDQLEAALKWRKRGIDAWYETRMRPLENDRWTGSCTMNEIGLWEYTIEAWKDDFKTWKYDFEKKFNARAEGETLKLEILEGAIIVEDSAGIAARQGNTADSEVLKKMGANLRGADADKARQLTLDPMLLKLMERWTNRSLSTTAIPIHHVIVERERARFSAWYEFFPRGAEGKKERHSTFRDCLDRVRYAKEMGFDVIYFPPIHPIGEAHRKGKDNAPVAQPGEPGSPWAIGGAAGGHYAVETKLGTLEDFEWLVKETAKLGVEIALDFALNCSPDHPYVKDHPDWFYQRPDGSIKYAENPPKKYQDIYPLNFHCQDWRSLWQELVRVVLFWVDKGVKIFRVDNPHTKPVAFWEFLIDEIQSRHPDVIFLAEAFTRPKMMQMLGKVGFSQSYTYFTWRVSKQEITEYMHDLSDGTMKEIYRPNFWPNTPDILAAPLVDGTQAAFKVRAALAATLSPSWGIYSGYEFCENQQHPDREEYRDNEKYELKDRDWTSPGIKDFIQRLNTIRNLNPAFRELANVQFLDTSNDQIIAFRKRSTDGRNVIFVVVNLDPVYEQSGFVDVSLVDLPSAASGKIKLHDLIGGATYAWSEGKNYVALHPKTLPVHILKLEP